MMAESEFLAMAETYYHGRCLMRRKLAAQYQMAKVSIGIAAGARSVASEVAFLVDKLDLVNYPPAEMGGIWYAQPHQGVTDEATFIPPAELRGIQWRISDLPPSRAGGHLVQ